MKRVLGWGLALALASTAVFAVRAEDFAAALAGANYKEDKGVIYSWAGFPGPTKTPTAALVLLEKKGPAEIIIGDSFSYQIQISNRTAADIVAVNLQDALPDGFAIESIDPKPDSQSGVNVTWNLGTIPAKTAKCITITGRAIQLGCLVSRATAKVCFELTLPLVTRVLQCNIALTKTLPEVADICDPIVLCLTVQNIGSYPATDVCITDELPEGLVTKDGRSKIVIDAGTIPVGGYKTFNVELKATATGEFTNTAAATAARNCYTQSSASIKIVAPELELVASGPADGYICTRIPYQITVTNNGDSPARDVILTDSITGAFKVEEVSDNGRIGRGNRVAWNLGTINPGESRTVCLFGSSTVEGSVRSDIQVSGRCLDPKAVSHCLNLIGVPGVLTSLKDNCDPVIIGGAVTYTITASNTGSKESRNLVYTIKLDDGMEYIGGQGVTAVNVVDAKTLRFDPLPVLAKGATAAWQVTVKATGVGDKRFTAELKTDELDSVVAKSESTNFYQPTLAIIYAQ